MNSPQSINGESKPEVNPAEEDKAIDNGDAATSVSSSMAEPSSPSKETEKSTPTTGPSQPATFVYDPNKITLKFIFANRDGVHVILECNPTDTVGEVKGALLSMWPEGEISAWFVHEPVLSSFCTLFPFTHTSKQSILKKNCCN